MRTETFAVVAGRFSRRGIISGITEYAALLGVAISYEPVGRLVRFTVQGHPQAVGTFMAAMRRSRVRLVPAP
jgi:hypothetical protein